MLELGRGIIIYYLSYEKIVFIIIFYVPVGIGKNDVRVSMVFYRHC